MDRAYDLSQLVSSLKPDQFLEFSKAVLSFHAAASVSLDLQASLTSINLLSEISSTWPKDQQSSIGDALFTHAVITYSRAAHSASNVRYNVGVTRGYSAAQLATHKTITALRDKSHAHWGPGELVWFDERVVCIEKVDGMGLTTVHRRMNFHTTLTEAMGDMLDAAIANVVKQQGERAHDLSQLLPFSQPDLVKAIESFPFVPEDFYGMASDGFWEKQAFSESIEIAES